MSRPRFGRVASVPFLSQEQLKPYQSRKSDFFDDYDNRYFYVKEELMSKEEVNKLYQELSFVGDRSICLVVRVKDAENNPLTQSFLQQRHVLYTKEGSTANVYIQRILVPRNRSRVIYAFVTFLS